jgi:hypothetical protein
LLEKKAIKDLLVHREIKETREFWVRQESGEREVHQVRWATKAHKAHKDRQEKKV